MALLLLLLLSVMNAAYVRLHMLAAVMAAVMAASAVTAPMVIVMVVPMVVMSMSMFFPLSLHQKAGGLSPLGPTRVLPVLSI